MSRIYHSNKKYLVFTVLILTAFFFTFLTIKADSIMITDDSLRIENLNNGYSLVRKPRMNTDSTYLCSGLYKDNILVYSLPSIEDTDTVYISKSLSNVIIIKSSLISNKDLNNSVVKLYKDGKIFKNYNLNNFFLSINEMEKTVTYYIWKSETFIKNETVNIYTTNRKIIKININTGDIYIVPSTYDFILILFIFLILFLLYFFNKTLLNAIYKKIFKKKYNNNYRKRIGKDSERG